MRNNYSYIPSYAAIPEQTLMIKNIKRKKKIIEDKKKLINEMKQKEVDNHNLSWIWNSSTDNIVFDTKMINSIENAKEWAQLESDNSLNILSISRHSNNNNRIFSEYTNTPIKSQNTIEFTKSIINKSTDENWTVKSFAKLVNEFAETYTESEYSLDINK